MTILRVPLMEKRDKSTSMQMQPVCRSIYSQWLLAVFSLRYLLDLLDSAAR
jgi:hypothetical protein